MDAELSFYAYDFFGELWQNATAILKDRLHRHNGKLTSLPRPLLCIL